MKFFVYQKSLMQAFHTKLFNYKITVNSQHENTNSKGDFVLKKTVLKVCFKDFLYTKIYLSQKYILYCYFHLFVTPKFIFIKKCDS